MFKTIKKRTLEIVTPHPKLVAFGISIAISIAISMLIGTMSGPHQAFADPDTFKGHG
jgi:hypothetical protein